MLGHHEERNISSPQSGRRNSTFKRAIGYKGTVEAKARSLKRTQNQSMLMLNPTSQLHVKDGAAAINFPPLRRLHSVINAHPILFFLLEIFLFATALILLFPQQIPHDTQPTAKVGSEMSAPVTRGPSEGAIAVLPTWDKLSNEQKLFAMLALLLRDDPRILQRLEADMQRKGQGPARKQRETSRSRDLREQ